MSADFTTTINVSGSKEGIVKVLEVVKYYEEERIKQYQAGKPYFVDYLEWVNVCKGKKFDDKKALRLEKIVDIGAYVKELEKGEITIYASGPYSKSRGGSSSRRVCGNLTTKRETPQRHLPHFPYYEIKDIKAGLLCRKITSWCNGDFESLWHLCLAISDRN